MRKLKSSLPIPITDVPFDTAVPRPTELGQTERVRGARRGTAHARGPDRARPALDVRSRIHRRSVNRSR